MRKGTRTLRRFALVGGTAVAALAIGMLSTGGAATAVPATPMADSAVAEVVKELQNVTWANQGPGGANGFVLKSDGAGVSSLHKKKPGDHASPWCDREKDPQDQYPPVIKVGEDAAADEAAAEGGYPGKDKPVRSCLKMPTIKFTPGKECGEYNVHIVNPNKAYVPVELILSYLSPKAPAKVEVTLWGYLPPNADQHSVIHLLPAGTWDVWFGLFHGTKGQVTYGKLHAVVTCTPKEEEPVGYPSPSQSASPSPSASPSTSPQPSLPVTGSSFPVGLAAGGALVAVVLGVILAVTLRRRQVVFTP